jgi:predicted small lipoprotein YifL
MSPPSTRRVLACAAFALLLCACGNKGPLVKPAPASVNPPAAPTPAAPSGR